LASETQEERAARLLQALAFSNQVFHYASSLRGTKQYQLSHLFSMVDILGLPTILLTHSASDHQ